MPSGRRGDLKSGETQPEMGIGREEIEIVPLLPIQMVELVEQARVKDIITIFVLTSVLE